MTEKGIYINNNGTGMEEALDATTQLARRHSLSHRDEMHLRLLAEEAMGMLRAITGEFEAFYSLNEEKMPEECSFSLSVKTDMNFEKREVLLNVSSTGKNAAARGIMGKIRDLVETGLQSFDEVNNLSMSYGGGSIPYATMGMTETISMSQAVYSWSLQRYRNEIEDMEGKNQAVSEAWDELEKSIVANLAKEITVGIRKDQVELTVYFKPKKR